MLNLDSLMLLAISLLLISWELFLGDVGSWLGESAVIVGLILWKLLSLNMRFLLDSLVHHQEGVQGLKGERKGLLFTILQLPCRQAWMYLKEFVLPAMMLHLPLAWHSTAPISILVKQKYLQALSYFLTNERYSILDQFILLRIFHHIAKVFTDFILNDRLNDLARCRRHSFNQM